MVWRRRHKSSRDFPNSNRNTNSLETIDEDFVFLQFLTIRDGALRYSRALAQGELNVNLSSPHLINGWLFSDERKRYSLRTLTIYIKESIITEELQEAKSAERMEKARDWTWTGHFNLNGKRFLPKRRGKIRTSY